MVQVQILLAQYITTYPHSVDSLRKIETDISTNYYVTDVMTVMLGSANTRATPNRPFDQSHVFRLLPQTHGILHNS